MFDWLFIGVSPDLAVWPEVPNSAMGQFSSVSQPFGFKP
jgi:hypothetical protein